MRIGMVILCLLAALSATPLRQSEAADDFGRSQKEIVGGHALDTIDGGVGDDRSETVLGQIAPSFDPLPVVWNTTQPASRDSRPPDECRVDRRSPIPESSSRRQSRLQCFLF